METRDFGRLGSVSALTLGGGGIGNVWGEVDRAEAVATVRAAVDAGITMLDLAPTYGPGEADHPAARDFRAAEPFRRLAAERAAGPLTEDEMRAIAELGG